MNPLAATLLVVAAQELGTLQTLVAGGLVVLMFLFGAIILIKMMTGAIDVNLLLSESGGGASMSRFQLLIFTFVIALSFFLLVINSAKFPDIPGGVLTLLGISATTYGVSKGIQASGGLLPKSAKPSKDGN